MGINPYIMTNPSYYSFNKVMKLYVERDSLIYSDDSATEARISALALTLQKCDSEILRAVILTVRHKNSSEPYPPPYSC